jgi:proline racemase
MSSQHTAMADFQKIEVIDSHTGGEPTRLVLNGGPDLGSGPLPERVKRFRERHDLFRSAIVGEPRASDVFVGALLVEPHDRGCQFGVIFFNNVGFLGMCGHGIIGVIVSLAHAGRIKPGTIKFDTPAGIVAAVLAADGQVSFDNVPSYRREKDLALDLPGGGGEVRCDLAWGGNWFCLVEQHGQRLELNNVVQLTDYCSGIRQAVTEAGYAEIDHVELFGPGTGPGVNSKNFVLCPGRAYDRSPCGTGTSAKLACLAADRKLEPGEEWVQESIVGSTFKAKYRWQDDKIVPTISGTAHVMAESTLLIGVNDPFAWGIR